MGRYAKGTRVPIEESRVEIKRTLQRYGADQFLYGEQDGQAVFGFRLKEWAYRINLPMPLPQDSEFHKTPTGKARSEEAAREFYQAEKRRRWRSLLLMIKAHLESVEDGIMPMESAFLPYLILPSGVTLGEWAPPQIKSAYASGKMPSLLPAHRPRSSKEEGPS